VRFREVTASVAAGDAAAAADVLAALSASGVSIEHPFAQADLEADATLRSDGTALVRLYVAEDASTVCEAVRDALSRCGIAATVSARLADEHDWAEAWKEHWHAERFGERIVVVPSWRAFDAAPGDVVLRLDPGMAFGTGQHETTRMCLEALERAVRPGARVLDLGCGSGILAIAAAKLGAREVLAVDINPDCARIAAENARVNDVEHIVSAEAGGLHDAAPAGDAQRWPFADPPDGRFDVVVANIVAGVIVDLAPGLVAALAPGGRLIVSGVIAAREREVLAALAAAGARDASVRAMGEWRCIEARPA